MNLFISYRGHHQLWKMHWINLFTLQKHTLIHTQPMNYSQFRFLFRFIRLRSLETQIWNNFLFACTQRGLQFWSWFLSVTLHFFKLFFNHPTRCIALLQGFLTTCWRSSLTCYKRDIYYLWIVEEIYIHMN